jgi:MEMO1 family protein
MLSFAAITPHTPLLIPTIGKDNIKKLNTTVEALEALTMSFNEAAVDTLLIISSHATQHDDAFSINLHDEYHTDFSDFGDMGTSKEFLPDVEFTTQVQQAARDQKIPFTLNSSYSLDHGIGVPLHYLTQTPPSPKIVPISYSGLSAKDHLKFGGFLKDLIEQSPRRIGIIASGDLSHCLSSDAPLGFKKDGEKFDETIRQAVSAGSTSVLIAMGEDLPKNAGSCLYKQLLVLFGILEGKTTRPEILSYEAPFGVGYMVAEFHL